jgi:PAS domain S-box-containing protein
MAPPAPSPDARQARSDAFRALADTVPVLLWIADADGRYVYLNERWSEFTGRPPGSDLGDGWRDRVHPHDIGRFLITFRRALRARDGFDAEYRLRDADGNYRWMLDRGVPREGGGMVGACVDITDRARAEHDDIQVPFAVRQRGDPDFAVDRVQRGGPVQRRRLPEA